ncbi:DUF378 domain-containing protein [Clostridium tertium]|jgi:uncharacterized membrane protein YuzA (DUF378 family)|uniref:DUF378 domain-containing protein n=1 Tax=Clostridium tertium TaxID=1559 RepID=A0A9X3XIP1_9CLOT|nr:MULTISPECIES: DUF378 domain-containing protein [Clostridium]EEH98116.1 hypothetical protein CSBG_01742 [Clostridium sp. 7_2_43FAA]MBS5305248.1 DUF378 domain-containing protein [Clostridium sp.]MBU6135660.1 DUF378 domain-containing protein [Clostridium tertium]MDB1921913.1 DUF378 domain-containing protein [Clostridium tertium]MDB1925302.1 DUF378 domain-containing protein [Clostridium tertium]
MCKINIVDKISFLLVLIGAINWGFIGLLSVNLVTFLVGGSVLLQRIIYIAVFAGAIDLISLIFRCRSLKLFS